jgi:hypothetical protein
MRSFLLNVLVLLCFTAPAQNTRIREDNTIGWFNNFTTVRFHPKWSGHFEYQWRRDDLVRSWQQSLLRTGINFEAAPNLQVRIGYAWIETFPYGEYPLQAAGRQFPEHRIYQMATVAGSVGRLGLNHRFMLEQRWIGRFSNPLLPKPDETIFTNRFRYMVRAQLPLNNQKMGSKTWYAAGYDEIFIGFGKNVGENVFDQNRLALLLGYQFNSTFRLESGFFQQIVQLGREVAGRNVFQYNNGIILNTYLTLDLTRKKP